MFILNRLLLTFFGRKYKWEELKFGCWICEITSKIGTGEVWWWEVGWKTVCSVVGIIVIVRWKEEGLAVGEKDSDFSFFFFYFIFSFFLFLLIYLQKQVTICRKIFLGKLLYSLDYSWLIKSWDYSRKIIKRLNYFG